MNKNFVIVLSTSLILSLASCGGSKVKYRAYEKQASPADIKISKLDLATNEMKLRFEYRSYVHHTLDNVTCDIKFNTDSLLNIQQDLKIDLDAFSTEVLTFSDLNIINAEQLLELKLINYSLQCQLKYNSGHETVFKNSALHLVPGTDLRYR